MAYRPRPFSLLCKVLEDGEDFVLRACKSADVTESSIQLIWIYFGGEVYKFGLGDSVF